MRKAPKDVAAKLTKILNAWKTLRPAKAFGGLTYDQFAAKVQASFDHRQTIANLELDLINAQDRRDDADKLSLKAAAWVVNGVKGDPTEGDNSALYEAMGYVRKSARKTGLTHKTKPEATKGQSK